MGPLVQACGFVALRVWFRCARVVGVRGNVWTCVVLGLLVLAIRVYKTITRDLLGQRQQSTLIEQLQLSAEAVVLALVAVLAVVGGVVRVAVAPLKAVAVGRRLYEAVERPLAGTATALDATRVVVAVEAGGVAPVAANVEWVAVPVTRANVNRPQVRVVAFVTRLGR